MRSRPTSPETASAQAIPAPLSRKGSAKAVERSGATTPPSPSPSSSPQMPLQGPLAGLANNNQHKLPVRSVTDVDLMVWKMSANAPISAQERKASAPLGLVGLLDDEAAQQYFEQHAANAQIKASVVTKGRDESGPVAPAFGVRQLERLLGEERERVAALEKRCAELEQALAKERAARLAIISKLAASAIQPVLCLVCSCSAPVRGLACGHVCLCGDCAAQVTRCPVCQDLLEVADDDSNEVREFL